MGQMADTWSIIARAQYFSQKKTKTKQNQPTKTLGKERERERETMFESWQFCLGSSRPPSLSFSPHPPLHHGPAPHLLHPRLPLCIAIRREDLIKWATLKRLAPPPTPTLPALENKKKTKKNKREARKSHLSSALWYRFFCNPLALSLHFSWNILFFCLRLSPSSSCSLPSFVLKSCLRLIIILFCLQKNLFSMRWIATGRACVSVQLFRCVSTPFFCVSKSIPTPPPTHTLVHTHDETKEFETKIRKHIDDCSSFLYHSLSLSSTFISPRFPLLPSSTPPPPSIPSHPTQHFKRNKSIKLKTTTTTATNYDTNSLVCYFAGQDVFQCFSFPVLFFDSRFAAIFLRLRPSPPPTFPETLFDDDDDDKGDDD